jgi:hypothetical protein
VAGPRSEVWLSTNNGLTWTRHDFDPFASHGARATIAACSSNTSVVYALVGSQADPDKYLDIFR